jgi:ribosomal protein S27E
MDIVFDCPNCEQELAVDSAGAGSEIECPSCGETIVIPVASKKATSSVPAETHVPTLAPSAINSSAAAKVVMHLKVPVRDTPGEILIAKPKPSLGKNPSGVKQLRIHTIRRAACIESGHDKFDEVVTKFFDDIGEENIKSLHTISYNYFDVVSQKTLTDYGLIVVYHG